MLPFVRLLFAVIVTFKASAENDASNHFIDSQEDFHLQEKNLEDFGFVLDAACPLPTEFPFLLWLAEVDDWNKPGTSYSIYNVDTLPNTTPVCTGPIPLGELEKIPTGTFGLTGTDPPFDATLEFASFQCFPNSGTYRLDVDATGADAALQWSLSFYQEQYFSGFFILRPPEQLKGATPAGSTQSVCFKVSGTAPLPELVQVVCPNTGIACEDDSECGSNCCILQRRRTLRSLLYAGPTMSFCGDGEECPQS